jgi:hypothetical protein
MGKLSLGHDKVVRGIYFRGLIIVKMRLGDGGILIPGIVIGMERGAEICLLGIIFQICFLPGWGYKSSL